MLFAVMVLFSQATRSPAQAAEEKAPANLLSNGSFNMGRQFWDLDKGGKTVATMDINADDAPPGGQSALITVGAIDSWGIQFGQKLDGGKAGKTYTFAVLARSAGDPVKVKGSPIDAVFSELVDHRRAAIFLSLLGQNKLRTIVSLNRLSVAAPATAVA